MRSSVITAMARRSGRRRGRLADGFIFFGGGVDHAVEAWVALRDRGADAGRSVDAFGGEYVALSGSNLGELTAEIDAWREAGGTHISVVTMGLGLGSVDAHVDYIASVAGALNMS